MLLVPRNPMVQGEEKIVFPPKSSMGLSYSKKAVTRLQERETSGWNFIEQYYKQNNKLKV